MLTTSYSNMTEPFLQRIARLLLTEKGSEQLSDLLIVLPSRRACRYFKYYLAVVAQKPLLAPEVLSMADFLRLQSSLTSEDAITLLFRLYRVYKRFDKDPLHNLEKFVPLGMAMLKDFNLIDMNLAPEKAAELFEYLEEVKAIERWAEELGADQELKKGLSLDQYFKFWENLRQTYLHFRQELLAERKAYHGLAFRWVYDHLDELMPSFPYQEIVFAGFSQLTHVEFAVMQKLVAAQKARIFWDTDAYYAEGTTQEAGEYFRIFRKHYLADHPDFHQRMIGSFRQEIEIIKTGEPITQVKWLAQELQRQIPKLGITAQSVNQIGILLPDESLLMPLLHSIPDVEIDGKSLAELTNITMGLPFEQSGLFHWLELWFRLQLNTQRAAAVSYYHQDIWKLLSHPFAGISEKGRTESEALKKWFLESGKVYATPAELQNLLPANSFFRLIFTYWEQDFAQAIASFLAFTQQIVPALQENGMQMELYYVQEFFKTIQRLQEVLLAEPEKIGLKTFRQFLFEILRAISIPFTGEPLGPVQVMGMLESRSLDFEHVYILSCNDGILPKRKSPDSLIPFDLRSRFKLPTYRENDASFAYTFYRLFHKAKKVTLVYSDPAAKPESGGMSRFLYQLLEEFKVFPQVTITEKTVGLEVAVQQLSGPQIAKDQVALAKIKEALTKGRSPSAISSYIYSPLQFYFDYVLKLSEETQIEENLDHRTLGTLIHETLDLLLAPATKDRHRIWEPADFEPFMANGFLLSRLHSVAANIAELKHMELSKGKNFLLAKIAERQMGVFLKNQQAEAPFRMVLAEEYLRHEMELTLSDGQVQPFVLTGKADRIDVVGNQLRVVDYKTGSFHKEHLKASSWEELLVKPEKGKIIQLMLYKYLLIKNHELPLIAHKLPSEIPAEALEITAGFYFFQQLSEGYVQYTLEDEPADYADFCVYVEHFLKVWIEDLLDASQPLSAEPSGFLKVLGV